MKKGLLPVFAKHISMYLDRVGLEGKGWDIACLLCFEDPDFLWMFPYLKQILVLDGADAHLKLPVHQACG